MPDGDGNLMLTWRKEFLDAARAAIRMSIVGATSSRDSTFYTEHPNCRPLVRPKPKPVWRLATLEDGYVLKKPRGLGQRRGRLTEALLVLALTCDMHGAGYEEFPTTSE